MKAMCNVEVRKLPYNTPHVHHHENGAWKLLTITDLLKEYGAVFLTSPRVRFRTPITFLLPFVKKHNGIIGKVNPSHKTVDVTHPNVYRVFNLSHVAKTYQNGSILSEDALLLVNNSAIYTTMLEPLRACALKWKCIAPAGATKRTVKPVGRTHTHRYEMSIFTLLMYRIFGDKWSLDTHVQDLMNRTYELVSSSHANDHLWAHFCNPPKKEVNCKKNESKC
ncbi:uncharacterized protein LOC117120103 [Anneissia japonica]|uniref:uncharacterized protein LOC117120103 n=1 Tax=Anneissia japonica TaxID=1529436 RepID=UPI001425951D|nr:uncharacterized protein LOC117120103 [Anneissia japonica]